MPAQPARSAALALTGVAAGEVATTTDLLLGGVSLALFVAQVLENHRGVPRDDAGTV